MTTSPPTCARSWRRSTSAITNLVRGDAPVVAAVQGSAAGAGMGFVGASDLVVAAESAKFVMAYTGVGLTPDGSSSWFLPRLVGLRRALELTLTNRVLSAGRGARLGADHPGRARRRARRRGRRARREVGQRSRRPRWRAAKRLLHTEPRGDARDAPRPRGRGDLGRVGHARGHRRAWPRSSRSASPSSTPTEPSGGASFSRTVASSAARWSSSCVRSASSCAPRMRTASRPALRALPTPTVATGMPSGICTIDSSESRPSRCCSGTGTPITGSDVIDAVMPGRCAAPPAPAMITRRPRSRGGACVLVHHVGRAVRRHDPHLVRDAELGEHVDRALHHGQVGVAAHDHADERCVGGGHRDVTGRSRPWRSPRRGPTRTSAARGPGSRPSAPSPSFSRALVASPMSRSTSAGRSKRGSCFT